MRISELSRACEVPVATVKYYLREGLLHDGTLTSATQAQYDQSHIARLKLIRALAGVGGLRVAAIRDVLGQIDGPPESATELLGTVHRSAGVPLRRSADDSEPPRHGSVSRLLDKLGWHIDELDDRAINDLSAALIALDDADFSLEDETILGYARALQGLAADEIAGVPDTPSEEAVRYVVLGTVLIEPLILALRRLAHNDAALRRFGPG